MRAAILIQGEPRFCAEFDLFIANLQGYTQIDWFFYLWKNSPVESDIVGSSGHQLVAPNWQHIDIEWAINKFKENLPSNHHVAVLKLDDEYQVTHSPITENYATETIQSNVWKMWYSQYQVNQLRLMYEEKYNFEYDIVIRGRPDVGLISILDLNIVKPYLDQKKNLIITPMNHFAGHGDFIICDLFGLGNSDNMNIYTDIYNQALTHHSNGVKFHPETMLARHLLLNGIDYRAGSFKVSFRRLGLWKDIHTGKTYTSSAAPQTDPAWKDLVYISNFGRWQ